MDPTTEEEEEFDPDITLNDENDETGSKKLWPSINNDKKAEWKLTEVSPLPTTDGKTYITVGTVDSGKDSEWDGFLSGSTNYSNDGIETESLADTILVFGVKLQTGYRFKSDNESEQVKATLIGQTWSNNSTKDIRTISASYTDGHYEIALSSITDADFTDYDGLELMVWADVEEKGNTISLSDDTDEATVEIGGKDIIDDEYLITDTTKDIEAVVSANGKMFEVMYSVDGDTWTSALKKGQTTSKPFADRAVSYGNGTYVIPKSVLKGSVEVKVLYLNEIELDWQDDANWNSVGTTAKAQRTASNSSDNLAIWGAQYAATEETKEDVLFVPQETKVSLTLTAYEGKGFTFTTVSYKAADEENATPGTIDETDKFKASLEIENTGKNNYEVVVAGTSTTYEKTTVVGVEDGKEVTLSKKAGTIEPRTEYTIEAFMYSGKRYPIGDIEVKVGNDDAEEKGWVVVTPVEEEVENNDDEDDDSGESSKKSNGTFTLKATKEAAEKTLTVILKEKEGNGIIDTLSLKVGSVIKSVAVAKATGTAKNTITQTINTTVDYVVTPSSKTSKDKLGVKVTENSKNAVDADEVTIEPQTNGTWLLTVPTTAVEPDDAVAKIAIFNEEDQSKEESAAISELITLTVNTTRPAWAVDAADKGGVAPTVKLAKATDVDLYLDMTLPKGAAEPQELPADTKYVYKVTVTPVGETKYETVSNAERYYEVSSATIQQQINAIQRELGYGDKAKFNVEVALVWYAPKSTAGGNTGGDTEEGGEEGTSSIASYTGTVLNDEEGGGNESGEGDGEGDDKTPPVTDEKNHDEVTKPDGHEEKEPDLTAIATSKSVTITAETKATYHADKITLKKAKAASGVYTGQTDAVVATVDFGKDATFISKEDVKVEVLNNVKVGEKDAITADIDENCQVILDVAKGTTPGKYKIQVTQTNSTQKGNLPDNAIQATATMDVTVVKGIENLDDTTQSTTKILVTSKKDGTAKITPVYNNGNAAEKPKTAKVDYVVGTVGQDGTFTAASGTMAQYITAKGGSVKVSKKYADELEKGSSLPTEFAVKVMAKDYDNSTVETRLDFSIATKAQELGKVVLVEEEATQQQDDGDEESSTTYKLVELDGAITADVAETYSVRVLSTEDGVAEKKTGLTENDFVDTSLYTLKLSKKGVTVGSDGSIQVDKVVDKLKISATATDGGGAKSPKNEDLELSVTYAQVAGESLVFTDGIATFDADTKKAAVTVPTGTVIGLKAVGKVGGAENATDSDLSEAIAEYPINYNKIVAVKGAKIVTSKDSLNVGIQMTAKEATVKLVPQQKKIGSETVPELAYTITNNNFDAMKKGPKVSLAKNQKILAGYKAAEQQKISFTTAAWKDLPDVTEAVVRVSAVDTESQKLVSAIDTTEDIICTFDAGKKTGEFTITLKNNIDVIKKATLYFDFYKVIENEEGEEPEEGEDSEGTDSLNLTPDDQLELISQTVALSTKTEILKKSYKLTNKYSMSKLDAAKVTLKESGKPAGITPVDGKYKVEFEELLNANLKGTVNEFTEAFKLETDGESKTTGRLLLVNADKASKTYGENKDEKVKGINNLTGFVKYTVTYDDGDAQEYITQITIDRKDAKDPAKTVQTLKASKATVLAEAGITAVTKVTAGKDAVALVGAGYTGDSADKITLSLGEKGIVNLKYTDAESPAVGTIKGTLRVIPESSMGADEAKAAYEAFLKKGEEEETDTQVVVPKWEECLEEYGIDVKVEIVVKAVKGTKGKVKVDNLKPSFKDKEAGDDGKYTIEASYTSLIAATISDIKADETVTPGCIEITWDKTDGKFTIAIDKAKYASYVKKADKSGKNYKLYGKSLNATVTFTFAATDSEAESYKLTITPPTLEIDDIDNAVVIKEVKITAPAENARTVEQGREIKDFTAEVTTLEGSTLTENQRAVKWEVVTDGVKDTTKFTGNTLNIANDEEPGEITVRATYLYDRFF